MTQSSLIDIEHVRDLILGQKNPFKRLEAHLSGIQPQRNTENFPWKIISKSFQFFYELKSFEKNIPSDK